VFVFVSDLFLGSLVFLFEGMNLYIKQMIQRVSEVRWPEKQM